MKELTAKEEEIMNGELLRIYLIKKSVGGRLPSITNSLSDVKVTNYIPSVQEPVSSELQLVVHAPALVATPKVDETVFTAVDQIKATLRPTELS